MLIVKIDGPSGITIRLEVVVLVMLQKGQRKDPTVNEEKFWAIENDGRKPVFREYPGELHAGRGYSIARRVRGNYYTNEGTCSVSISS